MKRKLFAIWSIIKCKNYLLTTFKEGELLYDHTMHQNDAVKSNQMIKLISWMESALVITSTTSMGFCILFRAINGECDSFDQADIYICNSGLASRNLPQ